MLERNVQRLLLDWLNTQPNIKVWRQNTGASAYTFKGKKRFVRFGIPGQSDLVGLTGGGRFLAVEVKSAKGKLTEHQAEYLNMVRKYGGIALCVSSLEELQDQLQEELNERKR